MRKIPATVITGFLGAGKTTLVRHLLQHAGGRRIALVINEFGDLGVDGDVLRGCGAETCREEDVVELTNGCICCTVADDFLPTMEKLLRHADRLDHIVIETSGLALPQPLVAAFKWPAVKARVTVDGVVTVIDAAAVASGRFADDEERLALQRAADASLDHDNPLEELFGDQIRAADLLVLNKADLVAASELDRVKAIVRAEAGDRPLSIVAAENGALPPDVLLGLGAGTEDLIASRPSHHELEGEEHDHDEFASVVIEAGPVSSASAFAEGLSAVLARRDILRLKGFAAVSNKPMRLLVQAVGGRIDTYFDRPFAPGEAAATRLVAIALSENLDEPRRVALAAEIRALAAQDVAVIAAAE